jgi:UPF0755 protein
MKVKYLLYTAIFLILVLVTLVVSYFTVSRYIQTTPSVPRDTVVDIPKGSGLSAISKNLLDSGVIVNDKIFVLYVMKEGWQDELKAGEYRFDKGSTMSDVAKKIVGGDVVIYRVTIPEGLTVKEVARLLDEKGLTSEGEFLKAAHNKSLMHELLGPDVNSFEGYLFPETYSYTKSPTAKELIVLMVERFKAVYEPLSEQRERVKLSDNEILTLASIIEKETGAAFERPLISAVFQNRLKIGMKLDSDPTVIYGMGENYSGNLRRSDLTQFTQYNTYVIKGLPPGPIANPGRDSIIAVLKPAEVDYLYFVSKGDGTHHFSKSIREHQNAVNKYQR